MESTNPYRPPQSLDQSVPVPDPPALKPPANRFLATIMLGLSVIAALAFVIATEVIWRSHSIQAPGLYLLFGTLLVSIFTAYITRDPVIAPLCCFGAAVAADILVGLVRDWGYAGPQMMIPLALACSIPALIVAVLRRRFAKPKLAMHG